LRGQLELTPVMDEAYVARGLGSWRNLIGYMAEQHAAERLGAERLSTDGRAGYCPDLTKDGVKYEVKAVGKSREVIVYSMRLEKDRTYAETHPLVYVLVIHSAVVPATAQEIRTRISRAQVWCIPFCYVDAVCSRMRPRILNRNYKPTNGWCQRGYERGGYLIPASELTCWGQPIPIL